MFEKRAKQAAKQTVGSPSRAHQIGRVGVVFGCGVLFLTGFFFTGRQHFASMDFGMKNSRMRAQVEELEAEKRRLLLAREISSSPTEIKKVAKKTGLSDGAIAPAVASVTPTLAKSVPAENTSTPGKPTVVKTASVAPSGVRIAALYKKPESESRETKKAALAE